MTALLDQAVAKPAVAATRATRWHVVKAYLALTKPRVIELLLVTTFPSMMLAARGMPPIGTLIATMCCGALAAGSANALNCYFDRDIDAVMRRTQQRPLARHTVSPAAAVRFGVVLGIVSVGGMLLATNLLAAGLTLAAILFYLFVYTLGLKRRTSQNIVWGGAAGCLPVAIGWAAVENSLTWTPAVLFLIVFFWTPAHFWALAMRFRSDYAAAGVPMLPVVAPPLTVAKQIFYYTVATIATSLILWPLDMGWLYGVIAVTTGAIFLVGAYRLLAQVRRGGKINSVRFFHLSNNYLALLFVAVALDALLM